MKNLKTMMRVLSGTRLRVRSAVASAMLSVALISSLTGCGSTGSVQLGAITVVDAGTKAAIQAATINEVTTLSVSLGPGLQSVNWTLTCLGSTLTPAPTNPCGTISPSFGATTTYTAPQYLPINNVVMITASLTSNPSVNTTLNLTINPLPIQIAITTAPPASLAAGGSTFITATVTNDGTAAGVNWTLTCGSSNCGTLASGLPIATQTASAAPIKYTAPASIPTGGTVTITAKSVADPTQSKSVVVTIQPLTVTIAPTTASVPIATTLTLTATVTFDSQNAGVDWLAPTCGSPGACGSLNLTHTASGNVVVYTPPSAIPTGTTVTVTAKSTTNPAVSASSVLTIAPRPPIAVSVTPTTASAQINGSVQLTATVLYDPANLGVNWTVSCGSSACGSVSSHTASGAAATFTAPSSLPAGGTVTVTATSSADATKSASATITIVPAISIAFTPALPTPIVAGTPTNLTATVTNDIAAAGVDWTVTCTNPPCGTFNLNGHSSSGSAIQFTAPATMPAGTVTITATATASNTVLPVKTAKATITITPVISISFVPFAPSQIAGSNPVTVYPPPVYLTAAVINDSTNAGIDWSVCSVVASCGVFQITPAIAATSTTPAANPVYSATAHTSSGQAVAYVPPTAPASNASSYTVNIVAKAHNPAATAASVTATPAIVSSPGGVALQGVVQAGTQPVSGASVTLYAAGSTGYSSAASPVTVSGTSTSVTTSSTGTFTIPAGYNCPSQASQMYLVSFGGTTKAGTNPNLAMMTALGSCGGLNSAVTITINEVTTVGSVWALAPFMSDYAHVGSSNSNATVGLANAFTKVNNLVNIQSGLANSITPAGNGTAPRAQLNTIANILNTCSSSPGGAVGDGSACGALFQATNTIGLSTTAPTNTIQAALNMAQTPYFNTGKGAGTIYSLLPTTPVFAPALTTSPNDWTLAVSYTGGGLAPQSYASNLAFDASGNLWITNNNYNSVTELNNAGAALSPYGSTLGGYQVGGISNPLGIAIDQLGNAWIANDSSITELAPLGKAVSSSAGYTGGGINGFLAGLAIDGSGNVWAANGGFPGNVAWLAGANATINGTAKASGTPLSPSTGFTQSINNPTGAVAVDTSGTVWVLNNGDKSATELNSANGNFIQQDFGYQQLLPSPSASVLSAGVSSAMTIDNSGNVFLSPGNQLVELLAGGSVANAGGQGYAGNSSGFTYSSFLALDGGQHIWVVILGGAGGCGSGAVLVEFNNKGSVLNNNPTGCGYLASSLSPSSSGIAADGSGGLWVLDKGNVTEFVGLATPVVTPFALGVQNKTLGNKP